MANLSPDWLTLALRGAGVLPTGAVKAFVPAPLAGGQGFYGQIVRLKLVYDPPESSGPPTLIAKFSSGNPDMRQRPSTRASYEREVRFYQQIAVEDTLPVPACYYADADTRSGWHILLLEDLAPARPGSRVDGCTRTEATTAIGHIARFHAHWWESPELGRFAWLADPAGSPDDASLAKAHQEWWPIFLEKAKHQFPDELMEIGELLGKRRGAIARRLWGQQPRTLIHSDFQLDNLLFGEEPGSLHVVDWQFVKLGRGMWDVAYFLSQNLASADRRSIEMDLVSEYIEVLRSHGVYGYSLEDAIYDYRLSLLHRLGALISTIAAMPFTPEQIRLHTEILLPRAVAAIADHDCLSLLKGMGELA